MSSKSRTAVSADIGLGLVGPEHTIVPLMASLYYSCQDPYAVKMAFHVGTDEPVKWALARDLLAASLHCREGIGDVQAWPSAASEAGGKTLNIAMTSPFGHAQFQASAAAMEDFPALTYQLIPDGQESAYLDFDAELTELLSQALRTPGVPAGVAGPPAGAAFYQAVPEGGGTTGGTMASIRCGPGSA